MLQPDGSGLEVGRRLGEEEEGPRGEAVGLAPQVLLLECAWAFSWRLPLAQVKAFVESDLNVTLKGQEAIFSLSQALETIANGAYCCAQQGKGKTLQRRDLDNEIEAVDEFAFLEGTLA
ncbi:DNA polymerase epsilon subunit 4-like [Mirounga leonina]|uniref:DNA polymerase epsilon subunit 4-like n=1 Tax=Mirounga leonina TaxID=9715 RepID=UPI00156BE61C|nr:DNA polymerase epsilon subunit 4-like [Mirounga leonina]XP_045721395.1 DNA polymerase epsilon subunit 4-like [Mirounga angustirostris]